MQTSFLCLLRARRKSILPKIVSPSCGPELLTMQRATDLDRLLWLRLLANAPGAGEHLKRAWKVMKVLALKLGPSFVPASAMQTSIASLLLRLADLTFPRSALKSRLLFADKLGR